MPITLTPEFQEALTNLDQGRSIFLTGKAGTGKSTLIRHFMENTTKKCVVVAPTGIAALNVNGYTIHRLFSFQPTVSLDDVKANGYYPRRFAKVLKELDILIIDEASMVRADLFDALEYALRRFGPHPGKSFGGVQIVLVGDLFQLPPVVTDGEQEFFATNYSTPYFFSAPAFHTNEFAVLQLTHVFRQAEDIELTEILNAIREGTISDGARTVLNSRTIKEFTPPEDEFWLTLTTTNRIATARNRAALNRLPGETLTSVARFSGESDGAEPATDLKLEYKVGAQIMMLINDQHQRFANGTLATIVATGENEHGPTVTIKTRDGEEVCVGLHTWEITRPSTQSGKIVHEVVGSFTQLPFRLAWAITIHKSQGQTVDRLVVDLSGGTFAYGQLYVALSRCTSMQGLVLVRDVNPKDLKTDQRVRRFLADDQSNDDAPRVYVGICSAGKEGRMTRPRPVEIALVRDDGVEITTLVNPESDLYDSRSAYGICAADVLAAPRLVEAWPALMNWLNGHVPVGVGIDQTLGWLDFELKRNGRVSGMPLGVSIKATDLTPADKLELQASTALERARAVRRIAQRLKVHDPSATPFDGPEHDGYLLPRGYDVAEITSFGTEDWAGLAASRCGSQSATTSVAELFVTGASVCFTGSVIDQSGKSLERAPLEAMATERGLQPVGSVTKAKCDVLVCAEVGTQSGKARKAIELEKPIVSADEFLAWYHGC